MTIDIWFAFAAIVLLLVFLPNPSGRLVASFSRQRGRVSAFVTVPPVVFGLTLCLITAAVPLAAVAVALPAALDALSWIGLGYLMLYLLWSLQSPQSRVPVADNDNLPERRYGRIIVHVARQTMAWRYVLVLAAMLSQFIDPAASLSWQFTRMIPTFVVCVVVGGFIQALFPRLFLRRRQYLVGAPASNKPRTVYIARRAVTAGFRRIAA